MCLLPNLWSSLLVRNFSSLFLTVDLPLPCPPPPTKKSLHGVPWYELVKGKASPVEGEEGQVWTKVSPSISFHFAAPETPRARPGSGGRWLVQSHPANGWKSLHSWESNIGFSVSDPQIFSHWLFFFFFCMKGGVFCKLKKRNSTSLGRGIGTHMRIIIYTWRKIWIEHTTWGHWGGSVG